MKQDSISGIGFMIILFGVGPFVAVPKPVELDGREKLFLVDVTSWFEECCKSEVYIVQNLCGQ